MLWVAQRVVSPKTGEQGINVYRYTHGLEGRLTDPRDYFKIPCQLRYKLVKVPLGGNRVRSFLDLGCPDDVTTEEITRYIQFFVELPASPAQPIHFYGEPCALRFGVEGALRPLWRAEFLELLQHVVRAEPAHHDHLRAVRPSP